MSLLNPISLLSVSNIGISFGGIHAVDGVTFETSAGQIFSIIGPNGAGKTTLFNLISGVYRAESGIVMLGGEDVSTLPPEALAARGLARTFQNLQIFFRMSALENVMVGAHVHEKRRALSHLFGLPSTARENRGTRDAAMALLERLHLAGVTNRSAGSLSYGQLKRLEIARALASRPKILLLDEPAAGCNPTETAEIDEIIVEVAKSGVAIVLVEHDMKLVMGVSDRVLVLTQGRMLIEGTPEEVTNAPEVIEAYLGTGLPTMEASHD
ncbi:MAG: branched-chain amino acid transport system ATP-binding [Beijerinckiaceae bacterium]|nr:MAG: branched-chain amino acid transport system ATP-binding [Beijerinckiaceae bacterium]